MLGTPLGARTVSYGRPPYLDGVAKRGMTTSVAYRVHGGRVEQTNKEGMGLPGQLDAEL
jgi:hypothetical protein